MSWDKSEFDVRKFSALDIIERLFLFLLLGWFIFRITPSLGSEPFNIVVLLSEGFTVCLVLFRKPGPMASNASAWIVAIVGTCAPMLVLPSGYSLIPASLGAGLMLVGFSLSLSAKIFLNRSFGIVAANRGLKRHGPYRLVRHPMYLGYLMTHAGFLGLHPSLWNAALYASAWTAMLLRIKAEEGFLSLDEQYRDYSAGVRYKLLPGLY
jgi:protein-S-isoprenylcysteine O-methyltransferase Ste14